MCGPRRSVTRFVPSKSVRHALLAINENIALARSFVSGMTLETYRKDLRSIYAVTRCLEIISEAARRLPDEMIARYPSVPWAKIRAAGNVYRHEYDDLSAGVLWATVEDALDELGAAVAIEIQAMEE
jgi:uncharacterized protein with HEPN domain